MTDTFGNIEIVELFSALSFWEKGVFFFLLSLVVSAIFHFWKPITAFSLVLIGIKALEIAHDYLETLQP
jgi:hypothetical protein